MQDPEAVEEGTPTWVKVFVVLLILAATGIVILAAFGDGAHGPSRHLPSDTTQSPTPTTTTSPPPDPDTTLLREPRMERPPAW